MVRKAISTRGTSAYLMVLTFRRGLLHPIKAHVQMYNAFTMKKLPAGQRLSVGSYSFRITRRGYIGNGALLMSAKEVVWDGITFTLGSQER